MFQHIESVYNLVKNDSFRSEITNITNKRPPRLNRFPRARTAPNKPSDIGPETARFLRKNQRVRPLPVIDRNEYKCVLKEPRPPVPKTVLKNPEKPTKNFVRDNVKFVANMEVKPMVPRVVVSCRGERQQMTHLLEGKKLIESDSFGRIPKYLKARKKAWEIEEGEEKDKKEKVRQAEGSMPGYSRIPEDQRRTLLKGLRERWEEVHKEFQVLPVLCDTVPKIKRKLYLEKELTALEKDIELLERNPYIYIDKRAHSV